MHKQIQTIRSAAHTSQDLFSGTDHAQSHLEFRGILVRDAEVRIKPVGADCHPCPVLCLELQYVGPGHQTIHAEQVHTEATRHIAEAAALRLKAGCVVTLSHPPQHLRLVLPFIEQIQIGASH
jgi:hypothetical protein